MLPLLFKFKYLGFKFEGNLRYHKQVKYVESKSEMFPGLSYKLKFLLLWIAKTHFIMDWFISVHQMKEVWGGTLMTSQSFGSITYDKIIINIWSLRQMRQCNFYTYKLKIVKIWMYTCKNFLFCITRWKLAILFIISYIWNSIHV